MKALIKIQSDLRAKKSQRNAFGKYNYRSCEDILEAVKPLLLEAEAYLTITDKIELVGERYYIKATATITIDGESVSAEGWAREADSKKGMDLSQISGACSSYARKYALNGLLAIDDAKDSDATNAHNSKAAPAKAIKPVKTLEERSKAMLDAFGKLGVNAGMIVSYLKIEDARPFTLIEVERLSVIYKEVLVKKEMIAEIFSEVE